MKESSDLGRNVLAIGAMFFIACLEYLKGTSEWELVLSITAIAGLGGFTGIVDLVKIHQANKQAKLKGETP